MLQRIKNNSFARNGLILFVGTMAASALNYVFHLAVGRMVSASVYGEVESLISLVAIISIPATSLIMLVTKFSAGNKAEGDMDGSHRLLTYCNKKIFVYGLPIFLLAIIFSSLIKSFLKIESVWPLMILWMMMLLSFFGSVSAGMLNGWQKFAESSWGGVWGAFFKLISALILIKLGLGLLGALGGFALGILTSYLISLYFLKFIWKRKDRNEKYEGKFDAVFLKSFIWPIFWGNLAITILSNADMVLAKHNLVPELAGQYGALTIISKIIFFATGIIATVLFSMSSEDNHKKNNSLSNLKYAFYAMSFISSTALIVYFFFPELIISLLYGDKYSNASPYLIWFAISVVIFSFVNLIFQYLLSIQKTKIVYGLLVISMTASVSIIFVGKDIFAIITVMIIAQILALLLGAYYLFEKPIKKTV